MGYRTEQEAFWAGEFGSNYGDRNDDLRLVASNAALFASALRRASQIASCIEFGANIGMNLRALQVLLPAAELAAVEINSDAAARLAQIIPDERIHNVSMLDFDAAGTKWDLVLAKGLLIHISPDALPAAYDSLMEAAGKYILLAEYYNPSPTVVEYRGHQNRLFKRDFAGDLLERFPELRLVDYGFVYRRDSLFALDDITWFLLEVV